MIKILCDDENANKLLFMYVESFCIQTIAAVSRA